MFFLLNQFGAEFRGAHFSFASDMRTHRIFLEYKHKFLFKYCQNVHEKRIFFENI